MSILRATRRDEAETLSVDLLHVVPPLGLVATLFQDFVEA